MITCLQILSFITFVASFYLSVACFCIVHRMTKSTPWSLAIAIIAIASLGAFGFLESLSYLSGGSPYVQPILAVPTVIMAIIFLYIPRIDVERQPHHG